MKILGLFFLFVFLSSFSGAVFARDQRPGDYVEHKDTDGYWDFQQEQDYYKYREEQKREKREKKKREAGKEADEKGPPTPKEPVIIDGTSK